jgi:hypothetical protein
MTVNLTVILTNYRLPEEIYTLPEQFYHHPELIYHLPEQFYRHPEEIYSPPEQFYRLPEEIYTLPEEFTTIQNKLQSFRRKFTRFLKKVYSLHFKFPTSKFQLPPYFPISSFHNSGFSRIKVSIISMHSGLLRLMISTLCCFKKSTAPAKVFDSPAITFLIPN